MKVAPPTTPNATTQPALQTTDGSPHQFPQAYPVAEDQIGCTVIRVFAWNHANDVSLWVYTVVFKRVAGTEAITVVPGTPIRLNSAGNAAAWAVAFRVDSSGSQFVIDVTGTAGQTVDWAITTHNEDTVTGPVQ